MEARQLLAVLDTLMSDEGIGTPATLPGSSSVGAGFSVSKNMAAVAESGASDSFAVVLTVQPDSDVVLTVTSGNLGEVALQPAELTFTPADWNTPQTVSVWAVDDAVADGTRYTDVTVSVDAERSDLQFASLDDRHVIVASQDNDQAGLWLSKTVATVSEDGTTDTFSVRLTSPPVAAVVLTVTSLDPGEAAVSPTVLTFSPVDWNLPQEVTVTGVDDPLLDDQVATQVLVSVVDNLSDAAFHNEFQPVHVATTDNDVPGFALSRAAVTVSESGTSDTFTIVLTAKPVDRVTLTAIRSDAGEAIAGPAVLTILPDEWDIPQTVTVTGVDDHRLDGDQTSWVTVSVVAEISDSRFRDVDPQAVSVTTTDDDTAGFTLSKSLALVSESGTSDRVTVVLTAQPETDVTLTVSSSDVGEATAGPNTLVFTPEGWDVPRTVTITGADDSRRDGDQTSQVTIAVEVALSDESFCGLAAQTVSVTTTDDDQGWQNAENPYDVSGNDAVDAADVLILINHVNTNAGRPVLPSPPTSPPPYYDVNNDGLCTAFDILLVINFINSQNGVGVSASSVTGGEGESSAPARSPAAPLDSASLPAGSASGGQSAILAARELAAADLVWLSASPPDVAAGTALRLAESSEPRRAVLTPVPVAATVDQELVLAPTRPRATSGIAGAPWSQAVDASLKDWDEGWEDLLDSSLDA